MTAHRFARLCLVASLLALPATAFAQGFGLNEIGSCAIARGFAVTSSPCQDASTIYWNPAYAAALSGNSLVFGGASIGVKGSFTRDSSLGRYQGDVPTAYPPHLFFNHRQSENFSWGLGVFVPYGLTSQWGSDFPGRFLAQKASIATLYVQPNFAWRLNHRWMIGGGPIVGHSSVELVRGLDLSQQVAEVDPNLGSITFGMLGIPQGTEFAQGTLKGSAYAYGFDVGLYGKIADHWTMGARYMSSLNFNFSNGKATFTPVATGLTLANGNALKAPAGTPVDALLESQFAAGGPLTAQGGSTELVHPDQLQAGVSYDGFDRWLLSADYAWIGWGRFHQLDIHFANPLLGTQTEIVDYNNSSSIRLGAQYTAHNNWQWRVGFAGAAAAAPPQSVTPIIPDQNRETYTGGLGIPLGRRLTFDAGYAFVWTPGRRGRTAGVSSPTAANALLTTGVYTLSANVLSFSLKASF